MEPEEDGIPIVYRDETPEEKAAQDASDAVIRKAISDHYSGRPVYDLVDQLDPVPGTVAIAEEQPDEGIIYVWCDFRLLVPIPNEGG